MSEKSLPEKVGIAETNIKDLFRRVSKLEKESENRKNAIIKAMWSCIKLLVAVSVFTLTTEKFKEKWMPIIEGWLGL